MKRAKIGYLKNNLSRYVDHVREGGEVVIYDRDTPVARMVPLARWAGRGADADRLERLERQGIVRRAAAGPRGGSPLEAPARVAGSVLADLLAERGESL